MLDVRNKLAEILYKRDLPLGDASVKEVVDMMMEAAQLGARMGYDKGVCDCIRFPDLTPEDKEYFLNSQFPVNHPTGRSVEEV
jgi:hypothetical protein